MFTRHFNSYKLELKVIIIKETIFIKGKVTKTNCLYSTILFFMCNILQSLRKAPSKKLETLISIKKPVRKKKCDTESYRENKNLRKGPSYLQVRNGEISSLMLQMKRYYRTKQIARLRKLLSNF